MGLWTLYFLIEAFLQYRGSVRINLMLNLLLLVLIAMPVPARRRERRGFAVARQVFIAIAAIALLWHESWLPPPLYAVRTLMHNGMPSREYLYQFFLRFYNPVELGALCVMTVLAVILRRHRKSGLALAACALLLSFVLSPGAAGGRLSDRQLNAALASFYDSESMRLIHFGPAAERGADFDILILQVCSLAWDDLHELGLEGDPFFRQFDFLFTDFNSVSTYSNPSAIRLLNAACGQRKHADLYGDMPKDCSLMGNLRSRGYDIRFARNHNGTYGKFDDEVERFGRLETPPFAPKGLEAKKYMFDDSPVYDDYALLSQWWTERMKSRAPKVALYYNTVSLHDGSHWIGDKEWWKRDHREQYREFLRSLLDDLTKFIGLVAASGRNAVIVVLGEHGRAVRGSAIETPGLRDVPLPRITLVPLGIKLVGKTRGQPQNLVIAKPASYFGLAYVLEAFSEHSPFAAGTDRYGTRNFIDSIPQTAFVSENEGNVIMKKNDGFYFTGKDGKWVRLTEQELK